MHTTLRATGRTPRTSWTVKPAPACLLVPSASRFHPFSPLPRVWLRRGAAGGVKDGLPAAAAVGESRRLRQPIRSLQQVQPHPHCVVTETGAAAQNPDGNLTPSAVGFVCDVKKIANAVEFSEKNGFKRFLKCDGEKGVKMRKTESEGPSTGPNNHRAACRTSTEVKTASVCK